MTKERVNITNVRFLLISLILGMMLLGVLDIARADNVTVITNMEKWKHPVKDVFIKHKVDVNKVELHNNNTYPIFYVKFPYDPSLGHNNSYFRPLYYETLKANGFWDYAFIDLDSNSRINIKWDKKTKTLREDQVELGAPGKEGESEAGAAPSTPGETEVLPLPPPLPD